MKWLCIVIWGALNIHKSHLPRNLGLLYVLVLFFIISVSYLVVFDGFSEKIAPGGSALARLFCLRGRGFAFSLCPGGCAHSKNFPGVLPGEGWSRLGLTDTQLIFHG